MTKPNLQPANMVAPATFSEKLSAFACATEYDALPLAVRAEARRVFANAICTMIAGSEDLSIHKFLSTLQRTMGAQTAAAFGLNTKLDPLSAAFINAASGNVLDYDDTHLQTLIHLGSVIYAATTALAQIRPVSGEDLLLAYAVASEVETRLGIALGPDHYPAGWHVTATCGTIGAAVACSKVLGLDARRTANAIGIATNMSGGLIENLQSMAKSIGVGNAARDGLQAALYAEAGVNASPTAIEGPLGFLSVYSDEPLVDDLFDDLGGTWRFLQSSCKPYASCVLLFPVIDSIMEIRRNHNVDVEAIDRVIVRGCPLLVRLHSYPISTPREAKLCLQHGAAVAIVRGTAGIDDFMEEAINDPLVRKIAGKVVAEEDASSSSVTASVNIRFMDGSEFASKVDFCRGSGENPLDDDGVREKCRTILHRRMPTDTSERLLDSLWSVDQSQDVGRLVQSVDVAL